MCLLDIINETESWWSLPERGLYHNIISLIIGQRIRFTIARNIRRKLFDLIKIHNPDCKEYELKDIEKLSDKELGRLFSADKIKCIHEIGKVCSNNSNIDSLKSINGIGLWTINALKIMMKTDNNIFLAEDYWIRQRLSEYKGLTSICTLVQARKYANEFKGYESKASNFFWRIKSEGINKLKKNEKLSRDDFI